MEKLLAIKPCGKEEPYNVQWSKTEGGRSKAKKVHNSAFLPTLYRIMGWNEECRYRCLGNVKELKDQKTIIFNLQDVEIIIPRDSIGQNDTGIQPIGGKRNIIAYPAEWSESFGSSVYEHPYSSDSILMAAESSVIGSKSISYGNNDLNVADREEVGQEIKKLITYFKGESIKDDTGERNEESTGEN